MKGKRIFYCELTYALGILVLAFGTALMEKADFGMSMVVAPAYLIHLKVSQVLPFFSFGMSEYVFQAVLLILLACVMGRLRRSYLLSFATAFLYGLVLDVLMGLVAPLPCAGMACRFGFYLAGMAACSTGVALLLHTYFPPEAYELVVKEVSQKYGTGIGKTKTVYDCCSCAFGIVLSLCFFGTFVGVKWGTVVCSFVNGWLIGRISHWLEQNFELKDALPLRQMMN